MTHSPFACATQVCCNSFKVFAVNFVWVCGELCKCGHSAPNIRSTCCTCAQEFTKKCSACKPHFLLQLFVFFRSFNWSLFDMNDIQGVFRHGRCWSRLNFICFKSFPTMCLVQWVNVTRACNFDVLFSLVDVNAIVISCRA